MKKIIALTLAALMLTACAHKIVYVMPDPPAELMKPPAKLERIKPGVVQAPTTPPT